MSARGILPGLAAGSFLASLIACAGGSAYSKAAAPQTASDHGSSPLPGDPRAEIARLDQQITDELAKRNLPPAAEPACTGAACNPAAVAMDARPIAADPATSQTCKRGASETCQDSCTLSDSICKSSERICDLAKQLGDRDDYANQTCVKASGSCKQSKERCCSCL